MKKIIFILISAVLAGGAFFFRNDLLGVYSKISLKLPEFSKGVNNLVQQTESQILAPEPLRAQKESPKPKTEFGIRGRLYL